MLYLAITPHAAIIHGLNTPSGRLPLKIWRTWPSRSVPHNSKESQSGALLYLASGQLKWDTEIVQIDFHTCPDVNLIYVDGSGFG